MTIGEILKAEDVNVSLRSATKAEAVEEVLAQLRGDARVKDWTALRAAVAARCAPALAGDGAGVCIAHARTPAVSGLVFAAGRSAEGVECPELGGRVRLIFVAGIPVAVDSEYLRLVGAIARVCQDPEQAEALLAAADGQAFVEILESAAERLN